jgi:hypothetical protein
MAQAATNKGKYLFATGGIVPGTTALKVGLLKTCANVATSTPDINFITDMEAHADFAELTAAGYARVALPGGAATENDASDYASIAMTAVNFSAISAGETIVGAFIYRDTGGSDTTREVIAIYDISPSIPTNGSTVTINAGDFARIV